MSPFMLIHGGKYWNRESIIEQGLRAHQPTEDGNYTEGYEGDLSDQPRGVYGFPLDFDPRGKLPWNGWRLDFDDWGFIDRDDDVWLAAYVGPLMADPEVEGAVVALDDVGPADLIHEGQKCDAPDDWR